MAEVVRNTLYHGHGSIASITGAWLRLKGFIGSQGAQPSQFHSVESVRKAAADTFYVQDDGTIEELAQKIQDLGRAGRRQRAYFHVLMCHPLPTNIWPGGALARRKPRTLSNEDQGKVVDLRDRRKELLANKAKIQVAKAKGTINDPTVPLRHVNGTIDQRSKHLRIESMTRAFLKANAGAKKCTDLVEARDHVPAPRLNEKPSKSSKRKERVKARKALAKVAAAKGAAGEVLSREERKEVERRQRLKEKRQRRNARKAEARALQQAA